MKITISTVLSMFALFCLVGCNRTDSIPGSTQTGLRTTEKVDNSADPPAREQAAREQAVREQAAREQAAREQAVREQAAREQAARLKTNIESVLAQDSKTNIGVQRVQEVVDRMQDIDTSQCPTDFRTAYLAHIHAWESMAQVEKDVAAFKANNPNDSVFVEAFLRGLLGDPLGKANEIRDAQTQLQRDYQEAHTAIHNTFATVEETAMSYGASAPK